MDTSIETSREMLLLERIEGDPDVTQASLAALLGVAVGTVNWHLKRLIARGYVKVKRAQRRKLRYIITPRGVSLRARLTVQYVQRSMKLYRKTRKRVKHLLNEARSAGYQSVRIQSENGSAADIVDICSLTCLEQGIKVINGGEPAPVLKVVGQKVNLFMAETDEK
ncbi:MAG: winged helix-turn-helix transcriptional regulator [Anaerolineales bacterium]